MRMSKNSRFCHFETAILGMGYFEMVRKFWPDPSEYIGMTNSGASGMTNRFESEIQEFNSESSRLSQDRATGCGCHAIHGLSYPCRKLVGLGFETFHRVLGSKQIKSASIFKAESP